MDFASNADAGREPVRSMSPYLHKLARALPIARTITHIRRAHSAGRGQRTLGLITGEWQHPDVCPVPVLLLL